MEAEPLSPPYSEENRFWKGAFAVIGIMSTLVIYGVLQASKKALDPVAPVYKYCLISVSNIVTTTCQYEALKYVSFPVQTLAKCAKMIPVMIWSTAIMQKVYKANDYFLAFLVMIGCALFILYPATGDNSPYNRGRESTVWGASLMIGYLGFDGFTSTFQDKLFRGYEMEIHNQIFYTTLCSCILSLTGGFACLLSRYVCLLRDILTEGLFNYTFLTGLILQGDLLMAIDFVGRHSDCFFDVALLSTVATASQFFISYTIRTFGALTFATIMTTRQLVSILLSCMWFVHPLSWEQGIGAAIVFGSLYAKSFLKNKRQKPSQPEQLEDGESIPLKENP
ncbi:hypothetical protein RHGRI_036429 [Rhododendron griersonianum]|uniref:Uncharacterized protein n=1 Tax=Rhododendron griersonianum TaxID=479676 RepID=A0AAV6HTK7_9ERIC|nr:hypothetical protein RHGRI_036429 [Rhododendron griersonianum]